MFDIVNQTWSLGPEMSFERDDHSCMADEETSTIHVLGGYNGRNGALKSSEKWTLGTDSWVSSTSLPENIYRSAAVLSNSDEYIGYLAGGWADGVITSKVWALRKRDMNWKEIASKTFNIPRRSHALVNIPVDQVPGC